MTSDDDDDNDTCDVESVGKASNSRCTSAQSLKQVPLADKENHPVEERNHLMKIPQLAKNIVLYLNGHLEDIIL